MTHAHSHGRGNRLRTAFFLTAVILLVEFAAGLVSHSLALMSDAGHILTDVVALGLAWFASEQAKRPADSRRSFGYHRVGVLAAMFNGAMLVVIVLLIGYEAVQRIQHPQAVEGGLVIGAALVAIAVNVYIALGLRGESTNINMRAAMLHVTGDLAASVGVVIAGGIILLTNITIVDPILSLVIAALIAWGAVRIILEAGEVLLEGTPAGIDAEKVAADLAAAEGVDSVHDLHIWAISPERTALSCHIVVPEQSASDAEHLVQGLQADLSKAFGIAHTTIQVEQCCPCEPGGPDCEGFAVASSHPRLAER